MVRAPLEDQVLAIVRDLSARHGWSWATERGFRRELERRTGRRIGARSFLRAVGRLADRGFVEHRRVLPGERRANGIRTSVGTTHNRLVARAERRRRAKARAREAKLRTARALAKERAAEAMRERQRQAALDRENERRMLAEKASPEQVSEFAAAIDALLRRPPPE